MRRLMLLAAAASLGLLGCTSDSGSSAPGAIAPIPATPVGEVGRFEGAAGAVLRYPARLAVDGDTVYVSDPRGNQVLGFRGGAPVVALTGLAEPIGLAVSGDLLFVGNAGRKNVEIYSLSRQLFLTTLGGDEGGAIELPNAIAVAPDGVVYVADSAADVIRVYRPDGAPAGTIGEPGTGDGQLRFPVAVAVDATRVVVGDQVNHRVQIFDRQGGFVRAFGGEISRFAKTVDDARGRFTRIQAIALRPGAIFVLDSYHDHVQVLDDLGAPQGIFGRAGDCADCTRLAFDIAFDADGRVLGADPEHQRWVYLSTEMR